MPPGFKTDPDLLADDRWSFVPGVGTVRTGPRPEGYWQSRSHHDHVADFYQRNPNGNFYASERNRELEAYPSHWDATEVGLRRLSSRQGSAMPSGTSYHGTTSGFSNFDDLANNLSTMFPGRQRVRERFGHTSPEYASRPYDYQRSKAEQTIKKEVDEEEEDPTPLLFPERRRCAGSAGSATPKKSLFSNQSSTHTSPNTPSLPRFTPTTDIDSGGNCPNPSPRPRYRPKRPPPTCTCPVDLHCGVKADHLIDCRPLVPESEQWHPINNGLDQDEIPWEPDSEDNEPFIPLEDLIKIIQLCNEVETLPRSTRRITAMWNWTRQCQRQSVTEDLLVTSGVIPRLEPFLAPANNDLLNNKHVPKDLREDMLALLRKWQFGDYSILPNRGLRRAGPRGQWNLDPDYEFTRKANFFGHGHLIVGQTWLKRLAMLRDGAHGMPQAGIHGSKALGAFAVVMGLHFRPETYADVDYGRTAYYIGTALAKTPSSGPSNVRDDEDELMEGGDKEPTAATQALMKSHETQEPVRMFRSYKAAKIVPWRPYKCYRYDGLYRVTDYECLKAQQQIYRFTMLRLPDDDQGQGPLRGWKQLETDARGRKRQEQRAEGRRRNFGSTNARTTEEGNGRNVRQRRS